RMTENILVFRRLEGRILRFSNLPRYFIEQARSMPLSLFFFRRNISFPFYRLYMQQFRTGLIFHFPEYIYHLLHIIPVNGAGILQVQSPEQIVLTGWLIILPRAQIIQMFPQGSYIRIDRNMVVIENYQQIGICRPCVIQGVKSHPGRKRSIPDDCNMLPFGISQPNICQSHSEGSGNRGRGMSPAKGIIITLFSAWETTYSMITPVGMKFFSPAGQNFMAISLMPYIPNQQIPRSVKDIMQSNCKFYYPQTGSKVTTIFTHHINNILTQLFR